jgi:hypothetical protein
VGVEEGEEAELELAPGDVGADGAVSEERPDRLGPGSGGVPGGEVGEGGRAREPLGLGLGRGVLEDVARDDGGEVEEGAGEGGDRDAAVGGHLVVLQAAFVDRDTRARPQPARHRDVSPAAIAPEDVPEHRR